MEVMFTKLSSKLILFMLVILLLLVACGDETSTETGQSAVQSGQELFQKDILAAKAGCKTCHSLEPGVTIVGPSLAGIASRAGERVPGLTAEEYIRQSILEPNAHVVEGFVAGTMPQDWGDGLTAEQIDQLVAYLMTLE